MTTLAERTPLHVPDYESFEETGISYLVDPEAPNWLALESSGLSLVEAIRGASSSGSPITFGGLVARHADSVNWKRAKRGCTSTTS